MSPCLPVTLSPCPFVALSAVAPLPLEGTARVIDIASVAANGLWVLGLALLLAAVSCARWLAHQEDARLRDVLGRPGMRRGIDLSLLLFCAGLAATSRRWWERLLWGLLAAAWAADAALSALALLPRDEDQPSEPGADPAA